MDLDTHAGSELGQEEKQGGVLMIVRPQLPFM